VAELSNNGELLWNTFLGSGMSVWGNSIASDNSNNYYIAGNSDSTWGSPIKSYSGGSDAFVAKLDGNGILLWNTFLGSINNDYGYAIKGDGVGNLYVTGTSNLTWGTPFWPHSGKSDAFIVKLNTNGQLLWNAFLGSSGMDDAMGIDIHDKYIYITGSSSSTWGNPIRSFSGGSDVFVSKILEP
jgi:hypothetical protein